MPSRNDILSAMMRAGYAARGAVYLIIGAIAIFAAVNGGEAEGSSGALAHLAAQPFGKVLLAVVAAGLAAYALWRFCDAAFDMEEEGGDLEGVGARLGQALSGATHAFLAVSAIDIILSHTPASGDDTSGNAAEHWSGVLMGNEFGRILIIAAGAVTFGVGVYFFFKARGEKWKKRIRNTQTTERVSPFMQYGLVAHGVVLLIIGALIAWAGLSADPETAASLGETLRLIEEQPFGRVALGLAGIGMVGFAAYCLVQARYRIAPKLATDDTPTLASA